MQIVHHGNNCPHQRQIDPERHRYIIEPIMVKMWKCVGCQAIWSVKDEEEAPDKCPCCDSPEIYILTDESIDSRRQNEWRFTREEG